MSSPPVRLVMIRLLQNSSVTAEVIGAGHIATGQPVRAFRGAAEPRIKRVAGVQLLVVRYQRGLCVIEMPDIVLGRICRVPPVEQVPHALLDLAAVIALRYNIVLMENMAEEMTAVE